MPRIITINVCIGPLCKHKIMGCSINGVKSECWRCRNKSTCTLSKNADDYNYDFCPDCLDEEMKIFLEEDIV